MMFVLRFLVVCACMLMLSGIQAITGLGCFNVSSVVVSMLLVFVFKHFSNEFSKFVEHVVIRVE